MDKNEIVESLKEIFCSVFDDDEIEISSETTAQDIEDWDSLTHIQLIVAIERFFGIRFNTGEVAELKNVGEMVDLICDRTL